MEPKCPQDAQGGEGFLCSRFECKNSKVDGLVHLFVATTFPFALTSTFHINVGVQRVYILLPFNIKVSTNMFC